MQRLEVSGVVRPIYGSLGVRRLKILHTIWLVPPSSNAHSSHINAATNLYTYLCNCHCMHFCDWTDTANPLMTCAGISSPQFEHIARSRVNCEHVGVFIAGWDNDCCKMQRTARLLFPLWLILTKMENTNHKSRARSIETGLQAW